MVEVRFATLDDTAGIVEVHQSNEDTDKLRNAKSLVDKWKLGGPWMALETCAIHLNYILNTDYFIPLVAEYNNKIVGEAEVITGEDIEHGKHMHISVIYVHKKYQRKGIGSLLINQLFKLAQDRDIHKITVNVEPAAKVFYEKHGFLPLRKIFTYSVPVTPSNRDSITVDTVREVEKDSVCFEKYLSEKRMCIGNYQSSKHMWFSLLQEKYPFFSIRTFFLDTHNFIVFNTRISDKKVASVYMWGEFTPNVLETIKHLAYNLRYKEILIGIQEKNFPARFKYVDEIWYKEL